MKKEHNYYVYILTNYKRTVLYIGLTNNIARRLKQHYDNRGKPDTFVGKYFSYNLVYYEWHQYIWNAINREKELKSWPRQIKVEVIESINPAWKFLNKEICGDWPPKFLNAPDINDFLSDMELEEDKFLQDENRNEEAFLKNYEQDEV